MRGKVDLTEACAALARLIESAGGCAEGSLIADMNRNEVEVDVACRREPTKGDRGVAAHE